MKHLFWGVLVLGFWGTAHAQPLLNAKCAKNINIRAPKDGAGVYFDRECKVAYVLPPVNGRIQLEAIAKTSNLDDCSIMSNLTAGFQSISRSWKDMAEELERSRNIPDRNAGRGGGSPLFPAPAPKPVPVDNGFDLAEWQKRLDSLLDSLSSWKTKVKPYADEPGATAQFSYQVQHQMLVEEYQKLNPNYTFRPIPLRESRIYLARTVGTAEERALFPAVIHASIPGFSPKADGDVGEDRGILSGEAQSGQISFSLLGICPYYNSASRSFPSALTGKELSANMVANVRYVYELQVARNYRMTYNMASMLRRLQTSESRGGFFTTKAINRLIVERSAKDEFDIEVESEDGRWAYDDQMAQTLKAQLIERAMADLNLISQGEPTAAPQATLPSSNGAGTAAKEIGKCPYVYCQIASGVLNIGNAIFGGTSTLNEYINKVDVNMVETSVERKMLTYRGTVNFTTKN